LASINRPILLAQICARILALRSVVSFGTARFIDELCESGAAMTEALPIDELRSDVLTRVRAAARAGLSVIATDDTLRA